MNRILLVDDEPAVLRVVAVMLRIAGLEPDAFAHPAAALKAFAQKPQDYALLVTDVMMPAMGGTELANRILQIRPTLPVIFITGYVGLHDLPHADLLSRFQVLRKPDQLAMLQARASSLLTRSGLEDIQS